ncbi:MAG TPA: hypothetical protein VMS98_15390 [Thermoanaerobaculia bacterium]|nr:hypothetical protein [Thermoanaerobaculia bacterium]
MIRRKPDLIFPERRRRKRFLTIRNLGIAAAVLLVLFVGISIRSELRGRNVGESGYGRLYGNEVPVVEDVTRRPVEPVVEAPVSEQLSADPFAVDAARREQFLRARPPEPVTASVTDPAYAPSPAPILGRQGSDERVVITGGPEGVGVVVVERERPELGGGFGKP